MPTATMTYGIDVAELSGRISFTYGQQGGLGRLELTGAQTYVVDLDWVPTEGLKGLLVTLDTTDASGTAVETPITVRWTSAMVVKNEELSPGGAFQIITPSPSNGVTAISIVTTANAVVHIAAVG